MTFAGWRDVAARLRERATKLQAEHELGRDVWLNEGQRAMLTAIAARIVDNGLIIADEVGMGKTRIAVELSRCVIEAGGRVAILVPPGLGFQWRDELRAGGVEVPPILRGIDGYFAAWPDKGQPQVWWGQRALIISHAFANWTLKGNVRPWRWALLPQVYANWRRLRNRRYPREYHAIRSDRRVEAAARSITTAVDLGEIRAATKLDDLIATVPWKDCLDPDGYTKEDPRRVHLETVVGIGLGVFDLVIVDEAHKSRGAGSVLSTVLERVLFKQPDARIVGMTATPVELDAGQWNQSLGRIGIDQEALGKVKQCITRYSAAIRRVRSAWRTSPEARREFAAAAAEFEHALSPFVLRRDKREDVAVRLFHANSGRPINEYRDETREIVVNPATLPLAWLRAVCAAEAMSLVARTVDGGQAKRLRLTMGSGHGIASSVDSLGQEEADDSRQQAQDQADGDARGAEPDSGLDADAKRTARLLWWADLIRGVAGQGAGSLFEHPAILAAMHAIEAATQAGEKVLVFGRFTAPMVALVGLLNAREMCRRLATGEPWPQSVVDGDERQAVAVAWRMWRQDHGQDHPVHMDVVDATLQHRYDAESARREKTRKVLLDCLVRGIPAVGGTDAAGDARLGALVTVMQRSLDDPSAQAGVTTIVRALAETIGDDAGPASDDMVWKSFRDLLDGAVDRDEGDADGDGALDEDEAGALWATAVERLGAEFNRPQGGFARLMNGGSRQSTRRLLQQAFNRRHSFPRVLVAQSMVGREGLNLHKACRIVVMLHLEWNPGVVEQQIGRVDRVQSHWAAQLAEALQRCVPANQLPRIEVRPVIFGGTYDQHHWAVLRERWDDLRAQLHGVVIPERLAGQLLNDDEAAALREVLDAAPSFSPMVTGTAARRGIAQSC